MDENRMNSRELSDDQLEEVAGGVGFFSSYKATDTVMKDGITRTAGNALSTDENKTASPLGTVKGKKKGGRTWTTSDTKIAGVKVVTVLGDEVDLGPAKPC